MSNKKIKLAGIRKKKAERKFMSNDFHSAIKHFTEAIELNPNDAMCWSFRANCHKRLKNHEDALKDSLKSIELNPKVHELTYLRVVNCHLLLGNLKEAREFIKQFQQLWPNKFHLIESQMEKLRTLEACEVDAQQYFNQDPVESLYHINQALEIAQECSRYQQMRIDCLIKLQHVSATQHPHRSPVSITKADEITSQLDQISLQSCGENLNSGDKCLHVRRRLFDDVQASSPESTA